MNGPRDIVSLSPRLLAVAAQVRPGSRVADIGTDHAYLPVYLVQTGVASRAYACDIRPGPLANAAAAVCQYGLDGRITLVLSDGLDALPSGCADDILIAGMGGETIADIVTRTAWLRDARLRLIVQPMTKHALLRRSMARAGFALTSEDYVRDGGRLYTVMRYTYEGYTVRQDPLVSYFGLAFCAAHPLAADYVRQTRQKLLRKYHGLLQAQSDTASECRALKELLDEAERKERIFHGNADCS